MREHRAQRVRLGVARIDRECFAEQLLRLGVFFGINRVVREHQPRADVVRIQLQRLLQMLLRRLRIARCESACETEMRLGIFRELLHRRRKTFRGECEIIFQQREFAVRKIRVGKSRGRFFHRVEKKLHHALRVRAEEDRRLSQRHAIRRFAIRPLTLPAEAIHFLLQRLRALRVAIRAEHIVAREPQPQRIRKAFERLGNHFARLGILSGCH